MREPKVRDDSMSDLPSHSDVVIVGGGAAGLAAARQLTAAGTQVLLLEAGPRLGGRIVTDQVDGFRLDRGFQVVNTAYPALSDFIDVAELDLRLFDHGCSSPTTGAGSCWPTRAIT